MTSNICLTVKDHIFDIIKICIYYLQYRITKTLAMNKNVNVVIIVDNNNVKQKMQYL